MRYSNFVFIKETKEHKYAAVLETRWFWIFKVTRMIRVFKPKYSSYWRDLETGQFTRAFIIEDLYQAWQALQDVKDEL